MSEKKKVDVRIAGNDYTLMGVESEEYIQKVGLYIDRKMNEIMKHNGKLSTSMAAVLTAINVADDFFKIYESETKIRNELSLITDELKRIKEDYNSISEENMTLVEKNSNLQLQLAKREAELSEVRNSMTKNYKIR